MTQAGCQRATEGYIHTALTGTRNGLTFVYVRYEHPAERLRRGRQPLRRPSWALRAIQEAECRYGRWEDENPQPKRGRPSSKVCDECLYLARECKCLR